MRTVLLVLLTSSLLACSGKEPTKPDGGLPELPPIVAKEGDWTKALPQSEALAGRTLTSEESGPWIIRRAVAPEGEGRERLGKKSRGVSFAGRGGGGAVGGAVPPGAPVESMDAGAVEMESGGGDFTGADAAPMAKPAARSSGDKHDGRPRSDDVQGRAPRLRAASTDDNEDFDEFVKFLVSWSDRPDIAGRFDMMDVRDRRFIRVVNRDGKPIPAAEVRVVDVGQDRVLLTGTTYGDGRVPYYPRVVAAVAEGEESTLISTAASQLLVEATFGETRTRVDWDGEGAELVVTLDVGKPVADPVALDVLFLIDTTGSMSDEIDRIKASLLAVTDKLRSLGMEFDLQYGAVLYRDIRDAYVTKAHPFTGDIRAFDQALQEVRANGGGDTPESLNQGLAEAIGRMGWRDGAAKVMFLIADAPPHMDYDGDVRYGKSLKAAVAKGIRIHSVAASGLDPMGTMIFRQIAQFTRGKFIFIEYGTVKESAAAHGVTGKVKSNNLDDIIFEQIRDEVAAWGRGD